MKAFGKVIAMIAGIGSVLFGLMLALVGDIAFGGILLAVGIVLIIIGKPRKADPSVKIGPSSGIDPEKKTNPEPLQSEKGSSAPARSGKRRSPLFKPEWWFDSYAVVDVETTGLDKNRSRIIEIAAVKVVNGEVCDTFSSLIFPEKNLPKKIVELTGITTEDLRYAPPEEEVIGEFKRFVGKNTLLAHNADFDMGFIGKAFERCGMSCNFNYLDTLSLARENLPGLPNYKLSTLIDLFSLADSEQTHRALDDALATQKLYELIKSRR